MTPAARSAHWIATAPAHWTRGRIKDLVASAAAGLWGGEPAGDGSDVGCVRAADFDRTRRRVKAGPLPARSVAAAALRRHRLRSGDVILEKSGGGDRQPVGTAVLYDRSEPAVCSNFCARIVPAPGVDSRFLTYVFAAAYAQGLTRSAVKQTTGIQNLDTGTLLASPWACPGPDEQHRIADFLDGETARIDRLEALTERQIDVLDERLVEAFREMTTTDGAAESAATGIDWMPLMAADRALWRIGWAFGASSGTTPRSGEPAYFGGEHYWVNTADLRDAVVETPAKTVTPRALHDYPALRMYEPGALVVAMYGATSGRVGILGVRACVNQACCVLSELGPVSSQYAFFWFRGHRAEILRLAPGGWQPNLSQDLVRGLRIPAPPYPEQRGVAERGRALAESVSRQQALLRSRAGLLAERRRSLIVAAVTGRFDVSSAGGGPAAL